MWSEATSTPGREQRDTRLSSSRSASLAPPHRAVVFFCSFFFLPPPCWILGKTDCQQGENAAFMSYPHFSNSTPEIWQFFFSPLVFFAVAVLVKCRTILYNRLTGPPFRWTLLVAVAKGRVVVCSVYMCISCFSMAASQSAHFPLTPVTYKVFSWPAVSCVTENAKFVNHNILQKIEQFILQHESSFLNILLLEPVAKSSPSSLYLLF